MLRPMMSEGFQPMLLCALLGSALSMGLWGLMATGIVALPHPWIGSDWVVHEMLFGFGGAALASFMLVAIANWSGAPIATGRGLLALVGLWAAGRIAVLAASAIPWAIVLLVDVAFLGFIALRSAQLLIRGKAPHNLPLAAVAGICALANLTFHIGAANGGAASSHPAARFGVALLVLMIALVGGRVLSLFTRNWLNAQGHPKPTPMFDRLDAVSLVVSAPALLLWAMHPDHPASAAGLGLAGLLNLLRWMHWQRQALLKEPLLLALQGAYFFVPVGFLSLAASILSSHLTQDAAILAWFAGALGLMPIAILARMALTQTGYPIKGTPKDRAGFVLIFLSGTAFTIAGLIPGSLPTTVGAIGLWTAGYLVLLGRYLPVLTGRRPNT